MSEQDLSQTTKKMSSLRNTFIPKRTRTYQLLLNQPALDYQTLITHDHPENIFRENIPIFVGEERNDKPIGGTKLLKKIALSREGRVRKITKAKIKTHENKDASNIKTRQKRVLTELKEVQLSSSHKRVYSSIEPQQQILKEHKIYTVRRMKGKNRQSRVKTDHLSTLQRTTEKQRKQYLDKSALLGQITHNKSLIDYVGDNYFQYLVRDRWKEQFKQGNFIYQLKKGQPFSSNKSILLIKKHHPYLKQRQRLTLHGRALANQPKDQY